jgi:hypothetical protein
MRKASLVFITVFALMAGIVTSSVAQSSNQSGSHSVVTFNEAEVNSAVKQGDFRDGLFSFSIGEYYYEVSGAGQLTVYLFRDSKKNKLKEFSLDFPDPALVVKIGYYLYEGDLIISYSFLIDALIQRGKDIVHDKVEQGRMIRIDKRTLETKWVVISGISDPGVPAIAGRSVYVSDTGVIGEIDLATGAYLWRHDVFSQRKGARFGYFKMPRIEGDYVLFEEDVSSTSPRTPRIIQVKRRTGKIISMNYKRAKK